MTVKSRASATKRSAVLRCVVWVVATALVWGSSAVQEQAEASTGVAPLATESVPFAMDSSNQAGWWSPIVEYEGDVYLIFNAPAAEDGRHEVHLARRTSGGAWVSGCLKDPAGECVDHVDDHGHNQPSLAIDGSGTIHAFVSMHNSPWQYYRSNTPGDVTSMTNHSSEMPDQDTTFTYPVLATAPNGDVFLIARVGPASSYTARLYQWSHGSGAWSRVAIIAQESGHTPYPDDLAVDESGTVHILWEWADGGAGPLRYSGSYLTYQPSTGQFRTVDDQLVSTPVTRATSALVYEAGTGVVQSARFALLNGSGNKLVGIAYRYQAPGSTTFDIRWAHWAGSSWSNETVSSGFGSPAAIAVTHHAGLTRIYYVKTERCDERDLREQGGLFVAERMASMAPTVEPSDWQETWLGGGAGVERLAVITQDGGTDALYLAAPLHLNPVSDPTLRIAFLSRTPEPGSGSVKRWRNRRTPVGRSIPAGAGVGNPVNWAYGAAVTVSSTSNGNAMGACATDGDHWSSASRWLSAADDPNPTITVDLGADIGVREIWLHSGYQGSAVVQEFAVDALVGGTWQQIASVTDNALNPRVVVLPAAVSASSVRLRMPAGLVRIYEIQVYSESTVPPVAVEPMTARPDFLQFSGYASIVRSTAVNLTSTPVSGIAALQVPTGWTAQPAQIAYDLAPGEQLDLQYRVTSAANAAPGDYAVSLTVPPYGAMATLELVVRDGVLYPTDGATVYAETGSWNASSLLGHEGSATRWAYGESGGTATWTPRLPEAGQYRVSVWVPEGDNAAAAEYQVTHALGTSALVVNQQEVSGAWHVLGTWDFVAGSSGALTLTATGAGYHRSGAVWFERV